MSQHEPPERLRHVFEFHDIEPAFTPERAEWLKDGSGFVYLIQCHEFVKIGIAENADSRLAYLQVGNPYELRLLKAFASRNPVADEEKLQNRLARYHERGEWYCLPEQVLAALLDLDDLAEIHESRITWTKDDLTPSQITARPFRKHGDAVGVHVDLPPRPRFFRFNVRVRGKTVYAGRVGKASPHGPTYIRASRSNSITMEDQRMVDEAIKTFQTEVRTPVNAYLIEYGKGAPTTESNATSG